MRLLCLASAAVVITGCGGGGDGGGATPPPPPVARVDVGQSAPSTSICGTVTLTATPRDAQGNALTRTVNWTQSNQSILSLPGTGGSVSATGIAVGTTNVTATSDGVPSTTTLAVAVTGGQGQASGSVDATVNNIFSPSCVHITPGSSVTWSFASTHNVIFDGPAPTGGNIGEMISGSASRSFPTAGSYPYRCTLHQNMTGRVIVN
jgi:plastocyanin